MHRITHSRRILSAENGFLLGNGDLSVSVYQDEHTILWRFGKGDVWDRRQDFSEDAPPAHIDEVRRGILEEGWRVDADGVEFHALHGCRDEQRSRQICQGCPPSYADRPYPCPKPVGELALHLPPDLLEVEIEQTLCLEEGIVEITCRQAEVFVLSLRCWVDEKENLLLVDWHTEASPDASYGRGPLVWFSVYRWADPSVDQFAAAQYGKWRVGLLTGTGNPSAAVPLAKPRVDMCGSLMCVRQDFYPEPTFPEGFCCLLAPLCGGEVVKPALESSQMASLHILPEESSGLLAVGVSTTADPNGERSAIQRLYKLVSKEGFAQDSLQRLRQSMQEYWSRSLFRCSESLLENLWYETLYAFRCIYRGGTVPPGLMFPSTLRDYSHWHGDYHSNYNFQQPFWGICAANHPEGLDSYFDGMQFFFEIGRKIAHKYYDARGAFVQLSAFPIRAQEDPYGVVPLGRMAYMTGWAATLYWERYLYTLDRDWLKHIGYPAIRDCALFYTDFVRKGPDGRWHAFPSNEGEEGFSGEPADFCDREEVADYLCYCLRCAVQAAGILHTDTALAAQWTEILNGYAADRSSFFPPNSRQRRMVQENPPEFSRNYLIDRSPTVSGTPWPSDTDDLHRWYFGHYPTVQIKRLHEGLYNTALDYPRFLQEIRRWRHPNGLYWALSVNNYGQTGAWTESLGLLGVVMESLLQSWDGCLRFFPGIPETVDLHFERFRTRGAFLVSADRAQGRVSRIEVFSEKGGSCVFVPPWSAVLVRDASGQSVPVSRTPEGYACFDTKAGQSYCITGQNL